MNTRVRASAATNASCPRYASRNTYLPYIMHGCDRFDLSRGRLARRFAIAFGDQSFNTLESHPFTVFVVFTVERFRHR